MKLLVPTFLVALFVQTAYAQQAGNLDVSFGDTGIVVTDLPQEFEYGHLRSILILPDGKIVSLGTFYTNSQNDYSDLGLMRHQPNGELDTSFGANGIVSVGLSSFGSNADFLKDAVLQSDGKIVCVGSIETSISKQVLVARFNQDGDLDSTFGIQGMTTIEISPQNDEANGIALDSNGMIVLGIETSDSTGGVVAKLNQNGDLDATFGNSGLCLVSHVIRDIAIDNSGRIIAIGEKRLQGLFGFAATRIENTGLIDQSFASNGVSFFEYSASVLPSYQSAVASSVNIQSDGKIILGGGVSYGQTSSVLPQFALCRLSENGVPDLTFGVAGGVVLTDMMDFGHIYNVTSTSNGIIYAVGTAEGNLSDIAIAAFAPNGNLETSFGNSGIAYIDIHQSPDEARSLQVLDDGNLVIGGVTTAYSPQYTFCIVKVISSLTLGLIDFKRNDLGIAFYPNPIAEQATFEYELKKPQTLTISLLDMQGRLVETYVHQQEMKQGKHDLQLQFSNSLESGTYLLSISSEKGQMGIRVIKR